MSKLKGPKFVQYFQPVIDGFRDLGSSAKPKEVYSWIAEHHDIPQAEIEGTTKGGQSKFENKVGWARFYLAKLASLTPSNAACGCRPNKEERPTSHMMRLTMSSPLILGHKFGLSLKWFLGRVDAC
ncbi:winged helix-turn-helix domain-containing protein, partial [uncultured Roseobacter sp.]|uniref:winged helix-turn-helix domain-containing protein n=1 Tax=uncultured Roseobacter sp. TaxID=114847 RepID=UPI002620B244